MCLDCGGRSLLHVDLGNRGWTGLFSPQGVEVVAALTKRVSTQRESSGVRGSKHALSLNHMPYVLSPLPFTLFPIPRTLYPTPYTL